MFVNGQLFMYNEMYRDEFFRESLVHFLQKII